MATKLKDLAVKSVDLVNAGANPDAHIQLFKRNAEDETLLQKAITALKGVFGKPPDDAVAKEAVTFEDKANEKEVGKVSSEAWGFCYMFSDSLSSIIHDMDLTTDARLDMLFESLDQFAEAMRGAIPHWAVHNCSGGEVVTKSAAQTAAFDELIAKYSPQKPPESGTEPPPGAGIKKSIINEEELDTMKIDKSKLTPEELAALEAIEKKYGTGEPGETTETVLAASEDVTKGADETPQATPPELHPEVKKALDENKVMRAQMEEMKKSLEVKDLSIFAKKYEVLGKKADELAPKLYDLKKAGGTAYDDYVGLLDEQLVLVEKSELFGEIGSARSMAGAGSSEIDAKAAEIRKNNSGMSHAAALAKAFEENPELAAKYEQEYANRGAN